MFTVITKVTHTVAITSTNTTTFGITIVIASDYDSDVTYCPGIFYSLRALMQ